MLYQLSYAHHEYDLWVRYFEQLRSLNHPSCFCKKKFDISADGRRIIQIIDLNVKVGVCPIPRGCRIEAGFLFDDPQMTAVPFGFLGLTGTGDGFQ